MVTDHPARVQEAIESFSPTSVCPAAGAFARSVVAQAAPPSLARAKAFLFAAAQLGEFAVSIGVEPSTAVLFDEALVERFILCGTEGRAGGDPADLAHEFAWARPLCGAEDRARGHAVAP